TRTTDIASIDAEGFLYIHGRADDAIIRGGFKVLPDMVADVFRGHPGVKDVAVVALKDPRLGEIPAAAIEVKPGEPRPSEADLEAFGRRYLVAYQVPARWLIVDELPRTTSLKVKLGEVKEMFARKTNTRISFQQT
ncbi:MAG TPA: long-chain fatty acid--CoA ligase, partial [Burkholderiales bacterium]|nr:long-chain fatty acid--CoA ligase [Burkholderiales bacterium]